MEILQRVVKRMPSFWLVDMPPESSIPFNINNEKLVQLIKTKDQDILQELGGVQGIISALKSNQSSGIRGDAADLCNRKKIYGSNSFGKTGFSKCFYSVLCGLNDFSVIMTVACAVYLIIAGILLYGKKYGWEEGAYALIFSSVFFVFATIVELGIDRYFKKVKKGSHFVVVLRNGVKEQIPLSGVVVGDIVCLKSGDKIPADGLFLDGEYQSVKLDENGEVMEVDHSNPFLIAGSKLVEGQTKMIVTSVGKKTVCYEKQCSLYHQEITQLEAHVHVLARYLERAKWILAVSFLPISLSRYFSGNATDYYGDSEFNEGTTTALEISYVLVENIFAVVAISIALDTTNFSWAVKVGLAHTIDAMAAHNIVVRSLSAWEKIGLGVATVNVVDESNTSITNGIEASKFLSVPQFVDNQEAPSLISPNVLELVQQGIGLNTTGTAYRAARTRKHAFSGSPSERAILSRAVLELGMDWEKLNQNCTILKVEELEMQGRGILMQKDESFHPHRRGPADMILEMCSKFYDSSGSVSFLDEEMRNLLEERLRSIKSGGKIQVIALGHREVSEEELINDPDLNERKDCFSLLGFIALKEVNQDGILKKVVEEYLNGGVEFNVITNENPVNGAAELEAANQDLEQEMLAEGTMSEEEDDTSVSEGSEGGEEITENRNDAATVDRNLGSASTDQLKVINFCLVEQLIGSEVVTSISPLVLDLLKQGIGLYTTGNVISCDDFSGSLIEKAIISWAIHELKLDLEELEKNFSIQRSENSNLENQGLGFLINMEDGILHVHDKESGEKITTMCSSYYDANGEKQVLADQERMLLEQNLKDLESSKSHWVAFVHWQVPLEEHLQDRTVLGILILCPENQEVTDNQEVNNAANEIKVSSEQNISISIGIEGDQTTRSSSIVILDGNYASLTLILKSANCILQNTQMFLQFQLTTSMTSILNTYISTVTLPGTPGVDTRLVYVLVQLIWVNLGMGLIAAVTFGRQKPEPSNQKRPTVQGKKWKLVTGLMWKNIMAQVAYQILAISILQFQGPEIFGYADDENDTITFVVPMLLQVFNMINARKIEENIFAGIRPWFVWLVGILMVVPFLLVEILTHFVDFEGLGWKQWMICVGIGMFSWPVGFAVKFVPVGFLVSPLLAVHHKFKGLLRLFKH